MSTYGPPPRRIVTINSSISADDTNCEVWEPAVTVIEEEIPRVSLLGNQAAKYPVFTHMEVPVNANEPYVHLLPIYNQTRRPDTVSSTRWKSPETQPDPIPHQGVNVQFLDLAPGAKVPLVSDP